MVFSRDGWKSSSWSKTLHTLARHFSSSFPIAPAPAGVGDVPTLIGPPEFPSRDAELVCVPAPRPAVWWHQWAFFYCFAALSSSVSPRSSAPQFVARNVARDADASAPTLQDYFRRLTPWHLKEAGTLYRRPFPTQLYVQPWFPCQVIF